ncbi:MULTISPECIES: hypothetical protein [Kyrpidia]|uniref:hypothetical protein n=1 Tax=Kyrpidia TaxID=1129704 RepID=UPI001056984E|nr:MULTISPECIES: hypothetical protein [Kyrpidia]MCL6576711.1 hypothetical protein [Kyrpidia sp.]
MSHDKPSPGSSAGRRGSRRRRPPGHGRGRLPGEGPRAGGRHHRRPATLHVSDDLGREFPGALDLVSGTTGGEFQVGQKVKYLGHVRRHRYRVGIVEQVLGDGEYLINIQHELIWTYGSYLEPTDEPVFYK